jgi:hypothetical protein
MYIVWDQEAVKELKKNQTLLELETFDVKGLPITCWCVVPAEKVFAMGFNHLDRYRDLHTAFVKAYYDADYKLCTDLSEHLIGQWGGELDTFYQEILGRFALGQNNAT